MTQTEAQQISSLIRTQLEENLHNRLTQATATGILTLFNKDIEAMIVPDSPSSE